MSQSNFGDLGAEGVRDGSAGGAYSIAQVLDLDRVRSLLESVHAATGDTLAVVDRDNVSMPIAIGFQDVCAKFHRMHPKSEALCIEASTKIQQRLFDRPFTIYECPHGVVDIAFPIVVDGQFIGSFWTGQIFMREPDWDRFAGQGRELGFDEDAYLAALRRVPVRSQAEVDRSLAFYRNLVDFLGEVGLRKLQQERANAELTRQVELARKQAAMIELQTKSILELSTPVIQVWDQILVMPLIGTIDNARAAQIMENLLEAVSKGRASVVIIDITGVPLVDTDVANHLVKTIRATRLLGAEALLTGVTPQNAQTLVRLSVDLATVTTRSSLQDGLRRAFELTRQAVASA